MEMRLMIAELSAAIDEKTAVKEKLTETVANLDRESVSACGRHFSAAKSL